VYAGGGSSTCTPIYFKGGVDWSRSEDPRMLGPRNQHRLRFLHQWRRRRKLGS